MSIWKNTISKSVSLVLVMMLCLSGCSAVGTSSTSKGNDENITTEETVNVMSEGEGYTLAGTNPVYDRSLTEGKMAVYFMSSDSIYEYARTKVYYGDSTLVIAPDGTTMLVDTQNAACTPKIVATLQALGIDTLDYLVLSHPHEDHIAGYPTLLRYVDVKNAICNDYDYSSNYLYNGLMDALKEKNIPITILREGDDFSFGGIDVKVMNPPIGYEHAGGNSSTNSGSLAFHMTYKDSTYLLCGDIEEDMELRMVEKYGSELQADICKTNHHGNTTSNASEWIKTVAPKIAVTEASQSISEKILGRYAVAGSTVLTTWLNKTVVVWTSGDGTYDVQVEAQEWSDFTEIPENIENGHFIVK